MLGSSVDEWHLSYKYNQISIELSFWRVKNIEQITMFTPGKKNDRKKNTETKWWAFQVRFISFSKELPFSGVSLLGVSLTTGSLMHVWTGRKIYHHSIPSSLFRWLQDRFRKLIHELWVFGSFFLLSLFFFPNIFITLIYIPQGTLHVATSGCHASASTYSGDIFTP